MVFGGYRTEAFVRAVQPPGCPKENPIWFIFWKDAKPILRQVMG